MSSKKTKENECVILAAETTTATRAEEQRPTSDKTRIKKHKSPKTNTLELHTRYFLRAQKKKKNHPRRDGTANQARRRPQQHRGQADKGFTISIIPPSQPDRCLAQRSIDTPRQWMDSLFRPQRFTSIPSARTTTLSAPTNEIDTCRREHH